jgi:hypothetical protein
MSSITRAIALLALAAPLAPLAHADTLTIVASRDNTIYSESGELSNGAGSFLFAGAQQRQTSVRAALIRFDLLAAGVPTNARITSAQLRLTLSRANSLDQPMPLHRMLANWGEGASNAGSPGGLGAPAQTGDATWTHAFWPNTLWPESGLFDFTASSSTLVGFTNGNYTWPSTATLIADVQSWVNQPATNFGWILLGNEEEDGSAKRFNSREHPTASTRPTLIIEFATACPVDYNRDAALNLDDLSDFITDFYTTTPIPAGTQPAAPTFASVPAGFGTPCPAAPDALAPYSPNAYRALGYRTGFSIDGSNACPADPGQTFPNLDNLSDYVTVYYAAFLAGC